MFVRGLPVFALLLAFGVSSASAQTQPVPSRRSRFSIGGNIRDQIDHHPMESIEVALKTSTGTRAVTAISCSMHSRTAISPLK
jgi:hypothetical protein